MAVTLTCEACGTAFHVKPSRAARGNVRFCSRQCRNRTVTRRIRRDGYVQLTGGGLNILEHRYIMEQHLGRTLGKDENVHHLNEVKHDNRLENLVLTSRSAHIAEYHASVRMPHRWATVRCNECGGEFERRLVELDAHPECFCSRECYRANRARCGVGTCRHCGQSFRRPGGGIFCNKHCYADYRRERAQRVD